MQSRDLILQLLADRNLEEADGRPLYAYRCTHAEFLDLQEAVRVELGGSSRYRTPGPFLSQAFCLWGAEWWRRNHQGGHWAWEELLSAVDCDDHAPGNPCYRRLCELVATGVKGWKRDLLRVAVGRAFLVTLACEGGLPLKLVLREQARLHRFFQTLLEEIRLFGPAGTPPEELAERIDHLLPRNLRQDVVYKLSGNLVARIWELQAHVGDSKTPLRDLDARRPGWRDDLPLSLEDDLARALLNNLLLDAADVARGGTKRIRWSRSLVRSGSGYRLEGELVLPGTMSLEDVKSLWPTVDPVPRRFEIWVEQNDSLPAVVAFATQRLSSARGGEVVFALEHVSNAHAAKSGTAAADTVLYLRSINEEASTTRFAGAAALTELPWVFEPVSDSDAGFRFVGEGSLSVRTGAALLALMPTSTFELDADSSVAEVGVLEGSERRLLEVSGVITIRDEEGNRVVIRTGGTGATEQVEFRAIGRALELGRSRRVCYLGQPKLHAFRPEGITTTIDPATVQWKPDRGEAGWGRWGPSCVGDGTVRVLDGGSTRWSSRLCILPAAARIELETGSAAAGGTVVLRGFGAVDVACLTAGVEVRCVRVNTTDVRIDLEVHGRSPTDVQLVVRWPRQGVTHLTVPFPALDARFDVPDSEEHDTGVAADRVVALNELSRVRAVVVAPDRGGGFQVVGSFREESVPSSYIKGDLLLELKEVAPGLHEQGLGMLQQVMASRFAFSDAPRAHFRLHIHSNATSGLPLRAIRVERRDLELRRVGDDSKVRIATDGIGHIRPDQLDGLRVQAIPLLEADARPLALEPAHSPLIWHVPEDRMEPGPWLIVALDGEWSRAHPLWWFVPPERGTDGSPSHPLLDVFQSDEAAERRSACCALIDEMKRDLAHPGWTVVDAEVELTQQAPAATMDLLCALTREPQAAALAAFRAPSENQFLRLWRALETLPFWWRAVPMEAWVAAATTYASGLQDNSSALEAVLSREEVSAIVRAPFDRTVVRLTSELPHLAPVLARAAARCFNEPLSAEASTLYRDQVRAILLAQRQPLLTNAVEHISGMGRYPDLSCVTDMAHSLSRQYGMDRLWKREPGRSTGDLVFQIFNAPIAAALCVVQGRRLSDAERYSLRTACELSPWWFGEVFHLTFLVAFGLDGEGRVRDAL